ncbi:hypothetical protein ANCCEY_00185 [Ancylostoma ceylanicum]|uniref:Uncharacterized protein n=1 Tax=Ancylostoma ceylanicum TaxID=53326 RepID=A0A0D6M9G8_9BILA|nr:hypothetical protein ANCCEY_00185 [Ancylostoma ceylanicum]
MKSLPISTERKPKFTRLTKDQASRFYELEALFFAQVPPICECLVNHGVHCCGGGGGGGGGAGAARIRERSACGAGGGGGGGGGKPPIGGGGGGGTGSGIAVAPPYHPLETMKN